MLEMEVAALLLEFKARNYKSFREELCLSMIPAPKQKDLEYSVMQEKVEKTTYKALCSSVIYGPNASGKTNVISALDTFRSIVMRGNIENSKSLGDASNPSSFNLATIPNNTLKVPAPVEFSIRFLANGTLIDYGFSMDLGFFGPHDYDRKILTESLSVNRQPVFTRNDDINVSIESLKMLPQFFDPNLAENMDTIRNLPGWKVEPNKLFLSNGFPSFFSPALHLLITSWLSKNLCVFCRSDRLSVTVSDTDETIKDFIKSNDLKSRPKERMLFEDQRLSKAVNLIGGCNQIAYGYDAENKQIQIVSVVLREKSGFFALPSETFESYGTFRFANLFPLLQGVFLSGGTLVMDEFDASLHPMVLMSIINLFHNDEINRNHAQLIFNTHNPIFLNGDLFRRDEIKFVERNEENSSELYALSDFGTGGSGGVRKHEDYMRHYFMNRYGAIQNVDFAPLFREIMEESETGREIRFCREKE